MLDVGWVWLTDYETGKSFKIGLVFATDYCRYEKKKKKKHQNL